MRRPSKKRTATKQPRYKHQYRSTRMGESKVTGLPLNPTAWDDITDEARQTVRRIDAVIGQADPTTTPDVSSSLGIQKCSGLTCANCEEWTSVFWVRARFLARKIAPERDMFAGISADLCVPECLNCGNWARFWLTETVERTVDIRYYPTEERQNPTIAGLRVPMNGADHGKQYSVIRKTGSLAAPRTKYI